MLSYPILLTHNCWWFSAGLADLSASHSLHALSVNQSAAVASAPTPAPHHSTAMSPPVASVSGIMLHSPAGAGSRQQPTLVQQVILPTTGLPAGVGLLSASSPGASQSSSTVQKQDNGGQGSTLGSPLQRRTGIAGNVYFNISFLFVFVLSMYNFIMVGIALKCILKISLNCCISHVI